MSASHSVCLLIFLIIGAYAVKRRKDLVKWYRIRKLIRLMKATAADLRLDDNITEPKSHTECLAICRVMNSNTNRYARIAAIYIERGVNSGDKKMVDAGKRIADLARVVREIIADE